MRHVMHVVGTRPNFMKIAPIFRKMEESAADFSQVLVHTGQHYDRNMSEVFFDELNLPQPDINLGVGSASHAQQTAQIMQAFEHVLLDYRPDLVLVPGDVNSTLACTLVATKLGFRVAHIEAGLRSFDRTMPEEINRVVTDQLADLLFTPSLDGNENLRREGIPDEKVYFVGNVMIDTLVRLKEKANARWPRLQSCLDLERYVLVTVHRPSNVDVLSVLTEIMAALAGISEYVQVVFPVHPRTRERISELRAENGGPLSLSNIQLLEPLGYLDFLALESHAALVLTDSGGVQEETTYLGVPCLTVRPNTERPITIEMGTNRLVDGRRVPLINAVLSTLESPPVIRRVPDLWDGNTATRIVEILAQM